MVDGCERLQAYVVYLLVIFAYIIEMSLMFYPLIRGSFWKCQQLGSDIK